MQNVLSGEYSLTHTRGAHLIKTGLLAEHYQDNMVNPTFAYGVYTFASLRTFIEGRPTRFLGLTPEAQFDRYWRFTLLGTYLQDEWRVSPRVTLNGGIRYEFATMPKDIYGRDSAPPNVLTDREPTTGQLYENPTYKNVAPRGGFAWDIFGDGSTSLRGGYGLYYNTSNQQTLIVTVTNPPRDAAADHRQSVVPAAVVRRHRQLDPSGAVGYRDAAHPRLQPERAARAAVGFRRHARLRGIARQAPAAQQRRQRADAGSARGRHGVLSADRGAAESRRSRRSS